MTAAGAAAIHGTVGVTTAHGVLTSVLLVVAAIELAIAVGAARAARWLPSPRTVALLLVVPVLLWAMLLLVAVTARAPEFASALATGSLMGASVLCLIGAAGAGADARRAAHRAAGWPMQTVVAVASATLVTALIVTPSVAFALAGPTAIAPDVAPATIEQGEHGEHRLP